MSEAEAAITEDEGGSSPPLPLAGVRVLEFGYGVAAPVACRNMAQFGADTIRVESARRPDSLRTVGAGWVPLETSWEILRDTGPSLHFTSPGKRSIGLEIDQAAGREIFHRLVAAADVLVMNMSVEAVAKLGLSYAEMSAINPRLIWMNMPSFGSEDGPYRTFRTWGRNIAAMAGLSRLVGWPDRDPVGMGVNIPDYVSALWGTIAVVGALMQRERTGEGCEIDVSQFQVALSCIGPTVMEAALGGSGLGTLGNRRDGMAPHGVYPSRAKDRWVAISVLDEAMWGRFCGVDGLEGLGRDERFSTLAGRLAHQDELDSFVAAWTGRLSAAEAAAELQGVRVAASAVADNWSVLLDSHLESREFFRALPHARFGAELSYGQAIRLSDTGACFTRAAPAFGEDTRDILRDLAGFDDDQIASAAASGVAHEMTSPEVRFERPYLHWLRLLMPLAWPPSSFDPATILFDRLAAGAAQAGGAGAAGGEVGAGPPETSGPGQGDAP